VGAAVVAIGEVFPNAVAGKPPPEPVPILVLLLVALALGIAAGATAWRYPREAGPTGSPSIEVARKAGESIRSHPRLRAAARRRFSPESATGLALTLALLITIGAGIVLGLLAYLVRTNARLISIDNGVARWGSRHATSLSTSALDGVTQLGSIYVVVAFAVVLAAGELWRKSSRWVVLFLVVVVVGEEIVAGVIKSVVDRARPTFNPAATTLGPSFPSGHATTAAAFYAAAALLVGRGRPRSARAVLVGGAVGIAVAVAASRVLLDVHWLTDVIGGLTLGWAWFSICGIAFGGRILTFGAPAKVAELVAETRPPGAATASGEAPPRRPPASLAS
jgi:membrane-associated phospholipid phosphatase